MTQTLGEKEQPPRCGGGGGGGAAAAAAAAADKTRAGAWPALRAPLPAGTRAHKACAAATVPPAQLGQPLLFPSPPPLPTAETGRLCD